MRSSVARTHTHAGGTPMDQINLRPAYTVERFSEDFGVGRSTIYAEKWSSLQLHWNVSIVTG